MRNRFLYHIPRLHHTLAQTGWLNVYAELKEYGKRQSSIYSNGLVIPTQEDGLKKYFILIREHPCGDIGISRCLAHELKHVYDKL